MQLLVQDTECKPNHPDIVTAFVYLCVCVFMLVEEASLVVRVLVSVGNQVHVSVDSPKNLSEYVSQKLHKESVEFS